MTRFIDVALIVSGVALAFPPSLLAQSPASEQRSPGHGAPIGACSLLPKEDVRKYLPWQAILDGMPVEEEPLGSSGSSCNYPSVFIQIMPFARSMIDIMREKGGLETVSRIGDEAYFYNNGNEYAELYVRAGYYLLTVQANVNGSVESVKPGVLNLAKALVTRLP